MIWFLIKSCIGHVTLHFSNRKEESCSWLLWLICWLYLNFYIFNPKNKKSNPKVKIMGQRGEPFTSFWTFTFVLLVKKFDWWIIYICIIPTKEVTLTVLFFMFISVWIFSLCGQKASMKCMTRVHDTPILNYMHMMLTYFCITRVTSYDCCQFQLYVHNITPTWFDYVWKTVP